jgi:putrescine---pyruvate transaminase
MQKYYEWNRDKFWHPWRSMNKLDENTIFVKGEDCHVTSIEGEIYFDAASAALNASLGYGREEVINPIIEQLRNLMTADTARFSSLPPIQLAKKLDDILPKQLSSTFFCTSGSEATETAIKMAKMYTTSIYGRQKNKIISFTEGYHGTTLLPVSASHSEFVQLGNEPLPAGFHQIGAPKCHRYKYDDDHKAFDEDFINRFIELISSLDPHNISAFIMEPILGIGGLIMPCNKVIRKISDICKQHNILIIFDETMTSFGRTGKMFGFEHSMIIPDILVSGKGISGGYYPLSAITTSDQIYKSFANDTLLGGFRHGHTNSGHAVGCASGLATINYILRANLLDNAKHRGSYLLKEMKDVSENTSLIKNVRGKGLLIGFDLKDSIESERFALKCFENNLIVRQIGSSIGLMPPLIITQDEAEWIISKIRTVINEMCPTPISN